jgi:hypothetical protein
MHGFLSQSPENLHALVEIPAANVCSEKEQVDIRTASAMPPFCRWVGGQAQRNKEERKEGGTRGQHK